MNANINSTEQSKSATSYEDFINENVLKHSQKLQISECDEKKFKEHIYDKSLNSEIRKINEMRDESESEGESEIDLTTTGGPKDFVIVNGCIDFSNNHNNNNNSDK